VSTAKTDAAKLLKEIEDILDWFESGEVDLDKALKQYQAGLTSISQLTQFLKDAKVQVAKINKKFD